MSITDSDPNKHLLQAIDNLFIARFYEDTSRVGKDSYNRDYLLVSNFSDTYIRDCVKQVMLKYCKFYSQPHIEGQYILKCLEGYDNNGVARNPRSAHLFQFPDQNYTKLWFLTHSLQFYNAEEHKRSWETELNNHFLSLDFDYEVVETIVSKEYSSTKITCRIVHTTNVEDTNSYTIETVDKNPDTKVVENYCMYLNIESHLNS